MGRMRFFTVIQAFRIFIIVNRKKGALLNYESDILT